MKTSKHGMSVLARLLFKEKGLGLVELIIALSLLSLVLAGGYMLYHFGYTSFVVAEGRSDVQQNVRMVADFISGQLRHATEVRLMGGAVTIPAASALEEDEHYIFVNEDGFVEYRTKGISRIIPGQISEKIQFALSFAKSSTHDNILSFRVDGTRNSEQTYSLLTKVFVENLRFQGKTITAVGADFSAVWFIKQPSDLVILSVLPNVVAENTGFSQSFNLTLLNDTFRDTLGKDDIELGLDFAGLVVVNAARHPSDPSQATVVLAGDLAAGSGNGRIEVLASGIEGEIPRSAHVLVVVPIGYLLALPNPVVENPSLNTVFTLTLINNTFKETISKSHIWLGEDFADLSIDKAEYVDPATVEVTLSGNLVHSTGNGLIHVLSEALNGGSSLTAEVLVQPVSEGPSPPPANFSLTVESHPNGRGTTIPATGTYTHEAMTSVALNAEGQNNWEFYRWLVNGSSIQYNPSYNLLMNGNKTVLAEFRLPLTKIPGGSYLRYNGEDYLKLTGANNRVLLLSASGSGTWSETASRPARSELEGAGWTDGRRAAGGSYWTSSQQNKNRCYYVTASGAFGEASDTASHGIREALTLSGTLFAYSGDGTQASPYQLQ